MLHRSFLALTLLCELSVLALHILAVRMTRVVIGFTWAVRTLHKGAHLLRRPDHAVAPSVLAGYIYWHTVLYASGLVVAVDSGYCPVTCHGVEDLHND